MHEKDWFEKAEREYQIAKKAMFRRVRNELMVIAVVAGLGLLVFQAFKYLTS